MSRKSEPGNVVNEAIVTHALGELRVRWLHELYARVSDLALAVADEYPHMPVNVRRSLDALVGALEAGPDHVIEEDARD